jgi:hypothetical protein
MERHLKCVHHALADEKCSQCGKVNEKWILNIKKSFFKIMCDLKTDGQECFAAHQVGA